MTRRVLLLLCAIIFYLLMEETLARGVLTIRLTDFKNQWGQTFDGACCDPGPMDAGGTCENQCDYVMRLIVSGLGRANDHVFLFHRPLKYDSNNIVFENGESNRVLTVLFDQWPVDGRVKMNAFFYDYDDYDHTTTLVDWFETDLQYDVSSMQQALSDALEVFHAQNVIGNRQTDKTRLTFEWSVLCSEGDDCIGPRPSTPLDFRTPSSVSEQNLKYQFNSKLKGRRYPMSSINNDYSYEGQGEEESYSPFRYQKQMFYPVGDAGTVYKPLQTNLYNSDLYRRQVPFDDGAMLSRKKKRRKTSGKTDLENSHIYETEMSEVKGNKDGIVQFLSAPSSQKPDLFATTNVLEKQNRLEAIKAPEFYDKERSEHNTNYPVNSIASSRRLDYTFQNNNKQKEEDSQRIDANSDNFSPTVFKEEIASPSTSLPNIPVFITENYVSLEDVVKSFLETEAPSRIMEINTTPETNWGNVQFSPQSLQEQGQNDFASSSTESKTTRNPDVLNELVNSYTQGEAIHQLYDTQTKSSDITTSAAKQWPFMKVESRVNHIPHTTEELPKSFDFTEGTRQTMLVTDDHLSRESTNFKNRNLGNQFQFGSSQLPIAFSPTVRLTENNHVSTTKHEPVQLNIPRDLVSWGRYQSNIKDAIVRDYDNGRDSFLQSDYPHPDSINTDYMYSTTTASSPDVRDEPRYRMRSDEYQTAQKQKYFNATASPAVTDKDFKKNAFESWNNGQTEELAMFDKGQGDNRLTLSVSWNQYEEVTKPMPIMHTTAENDSWVFNERWWGIINTDQQKATMIDWEDVLPSSQDNVFKIDATISPHSPMDQNVAYVEKEDNGFTSNNPSQLQHRINNELYLINDQLDFSSGITKDRNVDTSRSESRISTQSKSKDSESKNHDGIPRKDDTDLTLFLGDSNNSKENRIPDIRTTAPSINEKTDVDYNSYYLDPFGVDMHQNALDIGNLRYHTTQQRSNGDEIDNLFRQSKDFQKTNFYEPGQRKSQHSSKKTQENQDWDPFGINAKRFAIDDTQTQFYSTKQTYFSFSNKFDKTTPEYVDLDKSYFYDFETIKFQSPREQYPKNIQPYVSSSTTSFSGYTTSLPPTWLPEIWRTPPIVDSTPLTVERKTIKKPAVISNEFNKYSQVRKNHDTVQISNDGHFRNEKSEDYNTAPLKYHEKHGVRQGMNGQIDNPFPQNFLESRSSQSKKKPLNLKFDSNAGVIEEHYDPPLFLQEHDMKRHEGNDLLSLKKETVRDMTHWEQTIPTRALKEVDAITTHPLIFNTNGPRTTVYNANANFDEGTSNSAQKKTDDNSEETMKMGDNLWGYSQYYLDGQGNKHSMSVNHKEEQQTNSLAEVTTKREWPGDNVQIKGEFAEHGGSVETTREDSTTTDVSRGTVFEGFGRNSLGQRTEEESLNKIYTRGRMNEKDIVKIDKRLSKDGKIERATQNHATYEQVTSNPPRNSRAATSTEVFMGSTGPVFLNKTPSSLQAEPFWFTTLKTLGGKDSRSLKKYFELDYSESPRDKDGNDMNGQGASYSTSVANIQESEDNIRKSVEPSTHIENHKDYDQITSYQGATTIYSDNNNYKLPVINRNRQNPDFHVFTDNIFNEQREHLNTQPSQDFFTTTTTKSLPRTTVHYVEDVTEPFVNSADYNTPTTSIPLNIATSFVKTEANTVPTKTSYDTSSEFKYTTTTDFDLYVTFVSDEMKLDSMDQGVTPVTTLPLRHFQKQESSPRTQISDSLVAADRSNSLDITSSGTMLTPKNYKLDITAFHDDTFPSMSISQVPLYKTNTPYLPRNKILPRSSEINNKAFAPALDSPLWDITVEGYGSDLFLTTANVLELEPRSMKTLPEKGFFLHTSTTKQIPREFSLPHITMLKTRALSPSKYVPKKEMDIDKYKQFLGAIRAGPTVNVPTGGLYTPEKGQNGTNSTSFELGLPSSGRRRAERLQAEVDVGKMITRYWPAVLGVTVGTVFLVTALVTSILCRQRRLLVQSTRWDHSPQHMNEPPDINENSSSAASLTSDLTRSSINLV